MRCQVKTICFVALLIITFSVGAVYGDQPDSAISWAGLKSNALEIEDYSSAQGEVISSYIPFFKEVGQKIWGWEPDKELKNMTDTVFIEPRPSGANEVPT